MVLEWEEEEEEEEEGAVSGGFEEVFEWQNEKEEGFVRERERGLLGFGYGLGFFCDLGFLCHGIHPPGPNCFFF